MTSSDLKGETRLDQKVWPTTIKFGVLFPGRGMFLEVIHAPVPSGKTPALPFFFWGGGTTQIPSYCHSAIGLLSVRRVASHRTSNLSRSDSSLTVGKLAFDSARQIRSLKTRCLLADRFLLFMVVRGFLCRRPLCHAESWCGSHMLAFQSKTCSVVRCADV